MKTSGKKQLIIAGVVTEVCVAFPALAALEEEFEVFVVTDASGTFNEMTRAGAQLMTWFDVACELHRDWRNDIEGLALSLTVSDSGIGFDDLDQALLYQRFSQVDGSMTRRYGGLGIGLSICRQLSELIGASLSHESTPGLGSRFELSLVLAVAQVQVAPTPVASGPERF